MKSKINYAWRHKMSAFIQQSKDWHDLRKTKVGASDAPVIMQVSPWKTPYKLWEEKLGISEAYQNEAMKRGLGMEEHARQAFEVKTGLIMFPQVVFHPKHEWMMASLDGMNIEQTAIVEIKCAGKADHNEAKAGKVPEKYYPQLQHQLEVTGLDMAFYYSFDGQSGIVIEVGRNTKYISSMVQEEFDFYKCMVNFLPPKMLEKDFEIREDEIWSQYACQYKEAQKALIEAEKKEKELKDHLISMANGRNTKGSGISCTKIIRKGNIDYSQIEYLQGVDLDKYRKGPTEYWKLGKA